MSLRTAIGFTILLVPTLHGQARGPRHVARPTAAALRLDSRSYLSDRLVIKFVEAQRVRLVSPAGETLTARSLRSDGLDLARCRALLGSRRIERVFTRPVADLERERRALIARARAMPGVADPADLNNYYRVFTGGAADGRALLRALLEDPAIEVAYPEFAPHAAVPAQTFKRLGSDPSRGQNRYTPIPTPFFEPLQANLEAAPRGLGVVSALGIYGAQGDPRQRIVQIEGAWILDHEDIPQLSASRILGKKSFGAFDTITWRNHGTAIVGIMNAARDNRGVRGIVPHSSLWVAPVAQGFGNAVSVATAQAGPGDVFTSSLVHAVYYKTAGFHAPFDYVQAAYDAIRNAVIKGIVVTIAGGNTGVDLARREIYGTRYLSTSTPSGAWIIGATDAGSSLRVSWSNFGQAFAFNAWGQRVVAVGYGHLFRSPEAPERRSYTNIFGGTSAAAPQVAAVAASLQSIARAQLGTVLKPADLRKAIEVFGTKVTGSIGPRPNLHATVRGLGLAAGLAAVGESRPGDHQRLALELGPNEIFILLGAPTLARTPWPGSRFPLLVSPRTMVTLDAGPGLAGAVVFSNPLVPDLPWLGGQHIFYQAARFHVKSGKIGFTNAVDAWIRKQAPGM